MKEEEEEEEDEEAEEEEEEEVKSNLLPPHFTLNMEVAGSSEFLVAFNKPQVVTSQKMAIFMLIEPQTSPAFP
jgi:hypothetical protein